MFFVNLWLAFSLTNLQAPMQCLVRMFCWPKVTDVVETGAEDEPERIVHNVDEIRKVIAELQKPKTRS